MDTQLSEQKAKRHITIIGIFYLVSGIWEYLLVMRGESMSYFLLDAYHNYVAWIGLITFIVGVALFFRTNISRLFALALAWWNLFTAPGLEVWWIIYKIYIKRWSSEPSSLLLLWGGTCIIILSMTLIRLYVIRMLKISKAGYVFLKKTSE